MSSNRYHLGSRARIYGWIRCTIVGMPETGRVYQVSIDYDQLSAINITGSSELVVEIHGGDLVPMSPLEQLGEVGD